MKFPSLMKAILVAALAALVALPATAARCPPFYDPEDIDVWPGQHDSKAVEARLAHQMTEIQRGLAIGQIPARRAQSLFREQNWLREQSRRALPDGHYNADTWQMLDRDLEFAWRHIQHSRRDCGL